MLVAFSLAYLAERRQRAEAKKAEDTSAARRLSRAGLLKSRTPQLSTLSWRALMVPIIVGI